MPYRPTHQVRVVTAASLFDGHDASINIMRRILQESGAEVIHLGHNRSALEVVEAAIQEDVQAVAISSYQGGHLEYFGYVKTLLDARGAGHVKIYGGGGGVIVPREIAQLEALGITRIFSPEDGRQLGLQGMIDLILEGADFSTLERPLEARALEWAPVREFEPEPQRNAPLEALLDRVRAQDPLVLGRLMTASESCRETLLSNEVLALAQSRQKRAPVLGITGPGGAGKSSLTDELVLRFLQKSSDKTVAVLSVDPTKRRTHGALLGDRIRMNAIRGPRTFMRSFATRSSASEVSENIESAILVCQAAGFDLIIVETAGIGQKDAAIRALADVALYVMTAEFGAPTQLEKIEMIDLADAIAINKFERRGSEDALRDVRRQFRRSRPALTGSVDETLPIVGTSASRFNDPGVSRLFDLLGSIMAEKGFQTWAGTPFELGEGVERRSPQDSRAFPGAEIFSSKNARYLSDIADTVRAYHAEIEKDQETASIASGLATALGSLDIPITKPERPSDEMISSAERSDLNSSTETAPADSQAQREGRLPAIRFLLARYQEALEGMSSEARTALLEFEEVRSAFEREELVYRVRGQEVRAPTTTASLSGTSIPRVALPSFRNWGEMVRWLRKENVPGAFPFTAGVFPLKRSSEEPARMFAGEGPPERTNRRFHLLSQGQPSVRLSTAFDSVTLYGEDPDPRPDIFGKIGESGVSVATVEDAEKLYAGFDLVAPSTSVSMTINGPAPTVLAFFLNAAVRQQVRRYLVAQGRLLIGDEAVLQPDRARGARWEDVKAMLSREEYERIEHDTLRRVRGTVQADILKEDQAQNTCIFSTEFALRMMGDIQAFFIAEKMENYYSVSISGYHIAEAGANPITQLAHTLANGFTYVQYYLSRGMKIDDFAPNLSFFFSNGLDPEYLVLGRVARRIWAIAMKRLYGASERSQKLKYHIQTSGRSLHAMEIDFNDIRTTLQALIAIADNCNSLHTNAFDEALTTPTEQSVRRALAIQMIINREFGLTKNDNPLQGSFLVEYLTDVVERCVLEEFDRLTERGGVLGAMEMQYQRGKIQDESMLYERRKHDGSLPIIGVNTFQNPDANYARDADQLELRRASVEDKKQCIENLRRFQEEHRHASPEALDRLKRVAAGGQNIFRELMRTVEVASLGQITHALYAAGGQYRRNM